MHLGRYCSFDTNLVSKLFMLMAAILEYMEIYKIEKREFCYCTIFNISVTFCL